MTLRDRFFRPAALIPGGMALAMLATPMPALALILGGDSTVMISICGDGPPITLPINGESQNSPNQPGGSHDCCKTACHAALERKKKDQKDGCCK